MVALRMRIALGADLTAHPSTYTWTDDITSDLRQDIARGFGAGDEETETNSSLGFLLADKTYRYDPENPESDLWPNWGENTPVEFSIDTGSGFVQRCIQYVSELVPVWPDGKSKYRPRMTVVADGLFRRLGQGKTFESALRRAVRLANVNNNLVAGWTVEDGSDAIEAASMIEGGSPLRQVAGNLWDAVNLSSVRSAGPVSFGSIEGPVGGGQTADLGAAVPLAGAIGGYVDTGQLTVTCAFLMDVQLARDNVAAAGLAPGAIPYTQYILAVQLEGGGTFRFAVTMSNGSGDAAALLGYLDPAGTTWTVSPAAVTNFQDGKWHTLRATLSTSAGNLTAELFVDGVSIGSATHAGVLPRAIRCVVGPNQDFVTTQTTQAGLRGLSNISIFNVVTDIGEADAAAGWAGELATDRITRLCAEESVPCDVTPGLGAAMGPQLTAGLLANLRDVSRADFGVLDDSMGTVGYRTLSELYNQTVGLEIDATARQLIMPFQPARDDQRRRNRVTAQLPSGGSGPTIEDATDIALRGVYDETPAANVASLGDLRDVAGFRLAQGLQAGYRYPSVTIDPSQSPSLADPALALPLGGLLAITNPPDRFQDRSDIVLLMLGGTETFRAPGTRWRIQYNTIKADPWVVGEYDDLILGRYDIEQANVSGTWNGTSTGAVLAVSSFPPRWTTDPADYPFDLYVGGQRVTVSGISGPGNPQTFTVSVASVNGVSKSHTAASEVRLWQPARYGR